MKLVYPACFYQDGDSGAYAVEFPDLPGCVTGGDTLASAVLMAQDAASGWVLDELEDGKTLPPASPLGAVRPDVGGFVNLIALDMDTYTEKYGSKAVRKNLTVPAWLNTFAEAQNINFSQLLQDALYERFEKQNAGSGV